MGDQASRRTMVFIDGSAFRDTLRKAYYDKFRRLEESIDYHAFGQFLCAADEQLVRVNYCTAAPVEITEAVGSVTGKVCPRIARIERSDHGARRGRDGRSRSVAHVSNAPTGLPRSGMRGGSASSGAHLGRIHHSHGRANRGHWHGRTASVVAPPADANRDTQEVRTSISRARAYFGLQVDLHGTERNSE